MEKSIESIWKEGFLKHDALVVPKLNDLYNQKSKHIIDKMKRMFKINLYAIVAMALANFALYAFMGAPIAGAVLFLVLMAVAAFSRKLATKMKSIDTSVNSYEYLKSFDTWLKNSIASSIKIMRFVYPIIFLAAMSVIWHGYETGTQTQKELANYPESELIFGIPIIYVTVVFVITVIIAFFGGRIYRWDLNLMYGRIFRKLDAIIADMDDLRNPSI